MRSQSVAILLAIAFCFFSQEPMNAGDEPLRVFIFAGQSNMEGADSKVKDIDLFPPFRGLEQPQPQIRFAYCLGRENKDVSEGWTVLQPVRNMVGPELSFAREVIRTTKSKVAIIKVAAGGTHLGGDWNPNDPTGFKMYPLALKFVQDRLAELKAEGTEYQLEGFMWHQGENDMFNADYLANYGKNLKSFLAAWRRDLDSPKLQFYIGELCTKTIWGMDLRPRMYAISEGQKAVTANDNLADYVPTSHVGVEIGGGVGLHYHYGTLGQLQHGLSYAKSYLTNVGLAPNQERLISRWPYNQGAKVKMFVLAGHRNMEGERAFVQVLNEKPAHRKLLQENPSIAYRYHIGGGYRKSKHWEVFRPVGVSDSFGPELSFAATLQQHGVEDIAIAKFTHSGSQIIDWTPTGSEAKSRNLYPNFVSFIKDSVQSLKAKGHDVQLTGIFYHVGENDMSWGPFRKAAPVRLMSLIKTSREDLGLPNLTWYVSQQKPTDHERVNGIDVSSEMQKALAADPNVVHIQAVGVPKQPKQLVLNTDGIMWLGNKLAEAYLQMESH